MDDDHRGLAAESDVGGRSLSGPRRRLRAGRPLWLPRRARATPRYPTLSGPIATTTVVGGGMTGALIAYAFASAGISNTLALGAALERAGFRIGRNSSPFSQVCSCSHMHMA